MAHLSRARREPCELSKPHSQNRMWRLGHNKRSRVEARHRPGGGSRGGRGGNGVFFRNPRNFGGCQGPSCPVHHGRENKAQRPLGRTQKSWASISSGATPLRTIFRVAYPLLRKKSAHHQKGGQRPHRRSSWGRGSPDKERNCFRRCTLRRRGKHHPSIGKRRAGDHFFTGTVNPIGHPISPTIKVTGNPRTAALIPENIDVNLCDSIENGLSYTDAQ